VELADGVDSAYDLAEMLVGCQLSRRDLMSLEEVRVVWGGDWMGGVGRGSCSRGNVWR